MTDKLKTLAEEAKRFDGGDWYLFQHLIDHWSMDKQDAAYIAAMSPDVVLGLLAEVERLKAERKPNCAECTKWAKEQADNREWIEGVAEGKRIVEKLAAKVKPQYCGTTHCSCIECVWEGKP